MQTTLGVGTARGEWLKGGEGGQVRRRMWLGGELRVELGSSGRAKKTAADSTGSWIGDNRRERQVRGL